MSFQLRNAFDFCRQEENSYLALPSLQERESLNKGQQVKLVFQIADEYTQNEEKLWVTVRSYEDNTYEGFLTDGSAMSSHLPAGMNVLFQPEHILMIW